MVRPKGVVPMRGMGWARKQGKRQYSVWFQLEPNRPQRMGRFWTAAEALTEAEDQAAWHDVVISARCDNRILAKWINGRRQTR